MLKPDMGPVSLYLHVPFCAHKCPYCDFNAYSGLGRLIEPFVPALSQEIANWGPLLAGHRVSTISFGGGTPSLLTAAQVGELLQACRSAFDVPPDAEVSLEANPGTVSAEKLAGCREAGVNRLSF